MFHSWWFKNIKTFFLQIGGEPEKSPQNEGLPIPQFVSSGSCSNWVGAANEDSAIAGGLKPQSFWMDLGGGWMWKVFPCFFLNVFLIKPLWTFIDDNGMRVFCLWFGNMFMFKHEFSMVSSLDHSETPKESPWESVEISALLFLCQASLLEAEALKAVTSFFCELMDSGSRCYQLRITWDFLCRSWNI